MQPAFLPFYGGHTQFSSAAPVTSTLLAPRTGIRTSSLAGTTPTLALKRAKNCLKKLVLFNGVV